MPFSKVQRVAHQLGKSLRRTSERSLTGTVGRKKEDHLSGKHGRTSAFAVEDEDDDSSISEPQTPRGGQEPMEAALVAGASRYPFGFNRLKSPQSQSPDGSFYSIPTRGWESPSASVISAPVGGWRTPRGVLRPTLCFMCYKPGHAIPDCPLLPGEVREQAAHNRALYYRSNTRKVEHSPTQGEAVAPPPQWKSYAAAVTSKAPAEVAVVQEEHQGVPVAETPVGESNVTETTKADSKNLQGGM
jgi:hypothetical protein